MDNTMNMFKGVVIGVTCVLLAVFAIAGLVDLDAYAKESEKEVQAVHIYVDKETGVYYVGRNNGGGGLFPRMRRDGKTIYVEDIK